MLPANVAEGLYVDVLLGAKKLKAVGVRLDVKRLKIRAINKSFG